MRSQFSQSGVLLRFLPASLIAAVWITAPIAAAAEEPSLAAADALWARRSVGSIDGRARPEPVAEAIAAYETIVAAEPDNLEARWKLLRAIQFHGDHILVDHDERQALYQKSCQMADATRGLLGHDLDKMAPEEAANVLRGVPNAAAVYLQSAIHWGLWGQTSGKIRAARKGVAGKLRDFAQIVILLDERFDGAGGHRFMGRLHTEAPKIPLVTGWVDHQKAVAELERALQLAPEEPYNQFYLADALLRFQGERRSEAIERLEKLIRTPPRAESLIEDLAVASDARALLISVR